MLGHFLRLVHAYGLRHVDNIVAGFFVEGVHAAVGGAHLIGVGACLDGFEVMVAQRGAEGVDFPFLRRRPR